MHVFSVQVTLTDIIYIITQLLFLNIFDYILKSKNLVFEFSSTQKSWCTMLQENYGQVENVMI